MIATLFIYQIIVISVLFIAILPCLLMVMLVSMDSISEHIFRKLK
jgi:hypothetical protein